MTATAPHVRNDRRLLASCWTWAGDAGPGGPESSPVPWEERVAAVAASKWDGVGLSHADVLDYGVAPGLDTLRSRLEDVGVQRIELEFLDGWWGGGEERGATDRVRDELLDAAGPLGSDVLKVGAPSARDVDPADLPSRGRLVHEFGRLAERAGEFGVNIALEAMSHTNLPTFPDALDFVREVAHPGAGLAVDVVQLAKSGDDDWNQLPEQLADVPVFVVEIGDAPVDPRRMRDHGVETRCLPGRGDLDVAGFITAMRRAGWDGYWGVEIISDDLRALPVSEGLRIVRDGVERMFDHADAAEG